MTVKIFYPQFFSASFGLLLRFSDKLTVTNTYTQPSNGEVSVNKVWQDPQGKTLVKPEVNLTLYRKVAGGTEEQVPASEAAVKVVDGTTTSAKWTGLKTTDIHGKAYSFIVKESFKNAGDVNNGNWTLADRKAHV